MEMIASLEKQLADINKSLPKLPAGLTKWLADYGWLLVLIGVALSILALIALVPAALVVFGFSTAIGVGSGIAGYGFNPLVSSLAWLNVLLSIANLLVVVALEAMAIAPLKDKKHRGWQLIFIASLVSLVVSIVSSLITQEFSSLVLSLVWSAIGFYVLFQIRPHFMGHTAKNEKTAHVADKPAFKSAANTAKK